MRRLAALAGLFSFMALSSAHASEGHTRLLTYNVAGLPDGFATPHPSRNMGRIGQLLAGNDIVLLQEDFAYGAALRQGVLFPFQSSPFVQAGRLDYGDGLSQFANLPFGALERETWHSCNGIISAYLDCLTPKGFSFSHQTLANGVTVDVYDLHLDAGGSDGDRRAREAQIDQLIAAIARHSAGAALLVAGDTNIRGHQHGVLQRFEQQTGLVDVCEALHCEEPQRVDRIFFRSSNALSFVPRKWSVDRRFVDAAGSPLSDHLAVAAELDWASP